MFNKKLVDVCHVCLQMSDAVKDGRHDADGFSLSLSLPASISLRVYRLWSLLLKAHPQFPIKVKLICYKAMLMIKLVNCRVMCYN